MSKLYQVLGLSPGANEQQIKSAYRTLAKQFHPDVNAGDEASAQRFKEVNAAYETLGDPEARAVYDRALACRRVETRRRYWTFAATVAVNFVLITASLSLAVRWTWHAAAPQSELPPAPGTEKSPQAPAQHAAAPQPDLPPAPGLEKGPQAPAQHAATPQSELPPAPALEKSPQAPAQHAAAPQSEPPPAPGTEKSPQAPAQHAAAPQSELPRVEGAMALPQGGAKRRGASNWTTYQDARFDFALKYPTDVFVVDKGPTNDNVRTFLSQDGQALLRIFAAQNSTGLSLAEYRRSVIEERYAGVVFGRTPQRRFWFVLSGTREDMMLYERVTFSCDRRSVHGWQMIYPVSERTFYDRIADEVHRNYSHGDSADAHCGKARPSTWQDRRAAGRLSSRYSQAQHPILP